MHINLNVTQWKSLGRKKEVKEMFDLFGFGMLGNYEARKVDNTETEEFTVDTAMVTDRRLLYETAVVHKDFNCGQWVVLEWAATKEEAQEVHNKWVELFKNRTPAEITDCFTGETFVRQQTN